MEDVKNAYLQWNGLRQIFFREIGNYYNTPIGYVFLTLALLFNFLFFFLGIFDIVPAFWEARGVSVRGYMNLLPLTFLFLVPAVSMRIWAEERKQGTFELLMTLPVTDVELVAGKLLAAWSFVSLVIVAALPLTLSIALLGNLDYGNTLTMYLGSFLMAGAYVSMGMVISALTREQIVAFIIILFLSLFMFLGNYGLITHHFPGKLGLIIGFFSLSYHYSSFSRGDIAFGDVIYYLAFMLLMGSANIWILRRDR